MEIYVKISLNSIFSLSGFQTLILSDALTIRIAASNAASSDVTN